MPWHPTLGDVDSPQALADYQAAKREHKAEWAKAGSRFTSAARRLGRLKPVLLAAAMAFLALNLWTGSPLLALWIGSQVQGEESQPSMGAFVAVIVCLIAFSWGLYQLLKITMSAYQEATGTQPDRADSRALAAQHARRAARTPRRGREDLGGRADRGGQCARGRCRLRDLVLLLLGLVDRRRRRAMTGEGVVKGGRRPRLCAYPPR